MVSRKLVRFAVATSLFSNAFHEGYSTRIVHFVAFRWAWAFFGSFSTETVEFMPRIAPVFGLYTRMLLAFGFIFQMPTLAFFLARMGMVTPKLLVRNFKYAVLVQ